MGISRRARQWLLGWGMVGCAIFGSHAQEWGADKDVVILSPTMAWIPSVTGWGGDATSGCLLVVPEGGALPDVVGMRNYPFNGSEYDYSRITENLFPLYARSLTLGGENVTSHAVNAWRDDAEYNQYIYDEAGNLDHIDYGQYRGGYLHLNSFGDSDGYDPIFLQVGEGGILVGQGGHLRLGGSFADNIEYKDYTRLYDAGDCGWVNSLGDIIVATGGKLSVGPEAILSTGLSEEHFSDIGIGSPPSTPTPFECTQLQGNVRVNSGDVDFQGGVFTGRFSVSGNGTIQIGNGIFTSQGIRIQSDHLYVRSTTHEYEADMYGPGLPGYEGMSQQLVGGDNGVELSGTLHMEDFSDPLFATHGGEIFQEVVVMNSLTFSDNGDGRERLDAASNGTLHVIGDLAVVGRTTRGISGMPILIANQTIIHDGVTLTADARRELAWTGTMTFNPGSKLVVDGGFTFLSYRADHSDDDDEVLFIDGNPVDEFRLNPIIDATAGNTALIQINEGAGIGLGWSVDMVNARTGAGPAFGAGTFTFAAPTVILLDYNTITGSNGIEQQSQLDLGPGGKLLGLGNLTLGINTATAPDIIAGDPAKKALLVSMEEWSEFGLSQEDALEELGNLKSELADQYQYGLFKIDAITTEMADGDPHLTGMVSRLTASGAMAPALSAAGMNPQDQLLNVFDECASLSADELDGNPYLKGLYEGIGTDAAGSYAGLASAVNADGVVGGAATTVQALGAGKANISGRMGAGAMGNAPTTQAGYSSMNGWAAVAANEEFSGLWQSGFAIWAAPLYTHAKGKDLKVGGVNSGYKSDFGGGTLGFDYTTCDGRFRFGAAGHLGGGNTDSTGQTLRSKNDFTFGGVELYAGAQWGNFTVMANAGWSRNHNELGIRGFQKTKYDIDAWSLGASMEYRFALGAFNLIPGFGVEYIHLKQDDFRLTFANAPAFVNRKGDADVVNLPVSLRVNRDFALPGGGRLTPEIKGAWIPSVNDKNLTYNSAVVGVPGTVAATSAMMDRHTGMVGAGLQFEKGRFTAGAEYEYRFSNHFESHNVAGVFRIKF